jgi:radical SAM superfamily enzyme YgiQ (UPF0313 family)
MLLRASLGRVAYTLALRSASLTIGVDEHWIVTSDRGGRLYSLSRDGHAWRRGLNGRVVHRWHDARARGRETAAPEAADALLEEASAVFAAAVRGMESGALHWTPSLGENVLADVAGRLRLAATFDSRAARADAARFARVYSPIGILPPDQYLALVLQTTEGCSFGTCAFCDLYHEPYRVKTVEEFRRHVVEIRGYLGASIGLRDRSIFLGAANALSVPTPRLLSIFDVIASEFGQPARPVYAFVDAFTGTKKSPSEYRALAERGLRRVYVGLESGHDPLLRFVGKPAMASDALETVAAIKGAGIHVGVIAIVGLGGDRFAAAHLADTLTALNAMALGAGDIVYLSDLVSAPATAYPAMAATAGIRPLEANARREQRRAFRAGLVFNGPPPQVSTYDVAEFVY